MASPCSTCLCSSWRCRQPHVLRLSQQQARLAGIAATLHMSRVLPAHAFTGPARASKKRPSTQLCLSLMCGCQCNLGSQEALHTIGMLVHMRLFLTARRACCACS